MNNNRCGRDFFLFSFAVRKKENDESEWAGHVRMLVCRDVRVQLCEKLTRNRVQSSGMLTSQCSFRTLMTCHAHSGQPFIRWISQD